MLIVFCVERPSKEGGSGIGSFGCISKDLMVLVLLKKTLTHINSINPHIKFTIELLGIDGVPYLDTLTKPTSNSTESTDAQKTDIIYHWKSPANNCTAKCIDKTNRSLKERVSDHRNQTTSAIRNHCISIKHPKAVLNFLQ